VPGGRVAHIVTDDPAGLWIGEAMSKCGRVLLLASDDVPPSTTPTCKECA
jgi:hypothetical protein